MISKKMQKRLIEQIKHEWESQLYYQSMMAWCMNNDYNGFASWFSKQADEERGHGMRILQFIADADGEVSIPSLTSKAADFKDLEDLFSSALAAEQSVTAQINELLGHAMKESDHATQAFLQWFVQEQIEEEATARDNLAQVKRVKDNPAALFIMENELSKRSSQPEAE